MSHKDFLVELGTEELPPKALKTLATAFTDGILAGLQAAGLQHGKVHTHAAPRRLAVHIEQLAVRQADRQQRMDGPPVQAAFAADGTPTQAALGFARKCGVEVDALDRSGAKLSYTQTITGQDSSQLLPGIVEQSLDKLPIPKRMRWGARREEFVRPTQWLVMLLGEDVVSCTILGQQAGRLSRGHRFHHNESVSIAKPEMYLDSLHAARVMASFDERRNLIQQRVQELAKAEQGQAIMPSSLLDEVTALVEWPVPLVCSFEEHFLQVPQEALITTMQDNQKYFCLLDGNGKLLPRFITVANLESRDPAQVVSGNEKVVRPRLTDAEFFYLQDQKQPLESFNERLKNVVFQADLGTVYEKAQRVSRLAALIAERTGSNPEHAARAGILSKCDLATEMVTEFPEMQGIAGYYYARDSEPGDIAIALNEQYMPRGAGAELPATATGAALAIADKLDTLIGIFGIGMLPTGSKDPYALRRAALGVLRILIEKQLEASLGDLLQAGIHNYGDKIKTDGLLEQVQEFIFDRLRARYEDAGVDTSVYLAVRAVKPDSPLDFDQRVQAVQHFRSLPEAQALAAANKRVSNVLGDSSNSGEVQQALLSEAAEQTLFAALQQAQQDVAPLAAAHDYTGILTRLAQLQAPVDSFFDDVMVNADDSAIRSNRHALLAQLRGLFLSVADISVLG